MADLIQNAIYENTYVKMPEDGAILGVQDEDVPSRMTDYYFDIITEHSLSVQNQITDNFLENNTAVQDHIAHSPLTITLSGLSGDVVYTSDRSVEDFLYQLYKTKIQTNIQETATKLTGLSVLAPRVNNLMQKAFNKVAQVSTSVARYVGIVRSFRNTNSPVDYYTGVNQIHQNVRLKEVYKKLKRLSDENTSMWVHTPWGDFTDMYIQSITLRQENVNFITDLEITLKQLRFAEVTHAGVDEKVMSTYNAQAQSDLENNGKTQGKSKSILAKMYDGEPIGWGL